MTGALPFYVNVCINIKIFYYIMMSIFSELFNNFGTFGPIILIFLSMYLLWNKHNLFFYYNVGIFIDAILNLILKGFFKQPRPSENLKIFNLAINQGKRFLFKDGIPHDIFGMPSGHANSALFSTIFIYLSLRKSNILYIYIFISLLIMIQRVVYNHHTILQVIVGAIVGLLFGYSFYQLAREKMQERIREKPDDFGPI